MARSRTLASLSRASLVGPEARREPKDTEDLEAFLVFLLLFSCFFFLSRVSFCLYPFFHFASPHVQWNTGRMQGDMYS